MLLIYKNNEENQQNEIRGLLGKIVQMRQLFYAKKKCVSEVL